MPLAYSYLRMSRPEQATGDSLRRQLECAQAYANAEGLTLVEDYRDIGISAFKGRNLEEGTLGRFLAAVEAGEVPAGSTLIVESLDRISRQEITAALNLFLLILKFGIEIVTLTDGQRYTKTSVDESVSQLLSSVISMQRAHEESAVKAQRVSMAWEQKRKKAANGIPLTRIAPAWLELNETRTSWTVIESRASIVRRIFRDAVDGIGAYKIARLLTDEGHEPWGRRGLMPGVSRSAWQPSTVKKILANESVFGRFHPHTVSGGKRVPTGEPIDGYFPEIVSEKDFWSARAAITSRRIRGSGRKGKAYSNLLSGVCVCGSCGGPAHYLNKGRGDAFFQCDTARRRGGCQQIQLFLYEAIELGVFANLSKISFHEVFSIEGRRADRLLATEEMLQDRIKTLNLKQERLTSVIEDTSDAVDDAIAVRIRKIRQEIFELSEKLQSTRRAGEEAKALASMKDRGEFEVFALALNKIRERDLITDENKRYMERARIAQQLRRFIPKVELFPSFAIVHLASGEEEVLVLNETAFADIQRDLDEQRLPYTKRWLAQAET